MTTPDPPSALSVIRQGPALVVRLGDGTRANALGDATLEDLTSLLNGPQVAEVAAVLLAGGGERHFCAGLDLSGAGHDGGARLAERLRRGERLLFAAAEAIANCRRPVIGVLNGAVVGGGLELALACDWRIAHTGVRLAMPATRLGIIYHPHGLRRAMALLGPARARRLFLTGRPVEAAEALGLGVVDQVVAPEVLWETAHEDARLVAAGSAQAVEGTRALMRAIADGTDPAHVDALGEGWRGRAFAGPDFLEGMASVAERRPTRFAPPS